MSYYRMMDQWGERTALADGEPAALRLPRLRRHADADRLATPPSFPKSRQIPNGTRSSSSPAAELSDREPEARAERDQDHSQVHRSPPPPRPPRRQVEVARASSARRRKKTGEEEGPSRGAYRGGDPARRSPRRVKGSCTLPRAHAKPCQLSAHLLSCAQEGSALRSGHDTRAALVRASTALSADLTESASTGVAPRQLDAPDGLVSPGVFPFRLPRKIDKPAGIYSRPSTAGSAETVRLLSCLQPPGCRGGEA